MDGAALRGPIDRLVGGRDVVITTHAVRGMQPTVDAVRAHGARRILVLGGTEGTGDWPEGIEAVIVPATVRSMTEEVLALESLVERMGPEHHAALDAWDPDRTALVLGNPLTTGPEVGGRPIAGHRRLASADLEDKATADELLGAAGVATPPHEVVRPAEATPAAVRLEQGPRQGVVISAGGRNGGADGVRWVGVGSASEMAGKLVGAFEGARGPGLGLVRVAPFVEGTPCSIGALVTGDGVAVLRPVENITLRRGRRLVYSGLSTVYDPPAAVRDEMEAAARRVGEELRRRVDHRGGFAIDGIVTPDGWLATEVNTRLSGGFATHPTGGAEPDVLFLQIALLERLDDATFTTAAIETVYRPAAEALRCVRVARVLDAAPTGGPASVPVVVEGRTARPARPDEEPHGLLRVGEAASGGVVLARLTDEARPLDIGPPAAPLAASLLDLADRLWATGTGGLSAGGAEQVIR
ncbi:MAG TPA: ATP-grasp domain-containing protein [Iamia sp.]|jgi:hypothetical protein|nr:ATP-grasp domain-containing protein [Iamia sp.]